MCIVVSLLTLLQLKIKLLERRCNGFRELKIKLLELKIKLLELKIRHLSRVFEGSGDERAEEDGLVEHQRHPLNGHDGPDLPSRPA